MTHNPLSQRLSAAQSRLAPHELLLISRPSDLYYFSGYEQLVAEEREAYALIGKNTALLLYNHFSPIPPQTPFVLLPDCSESAVNHEIKNWMHRLESSPQPQLHLDEAALSFAEYKTITVGLKCELRPQDRKHITAIREVKDHSEIEQMQQASLIASRALAATISQLTPGMTELDVKQDFETRVYQLGGAGMAFPSVIAFGVNTALPHHQPGKTQLTKEMAVLLDVGAKTGWYRSDMTRSFWFGKKPPEKFQLIEKTVLDAYELAVALLKRANAINDLTAKDIDDVVRQHIHAAGFSNREFPHTTGHGIGLDIHESPSLSWRNVEHLQENFVVTIEPGIYLEGLFGFRFEETVLLKNGAPVIFTTDS